jgi:beta-glucosidase
LTEPGIAASADSAEPGDLAARFPGNFIWGVATSAFQIEGGTADDGRGESIWDVFCRQPGAIADGSNGLTACRHYERYESDVGLIAGLNVGAYRFSVMWPRVRPTGEGAWNEKGFDFYDRLIDRLLDRGIAPHLVLNHWDLPQALQQTGGWAARDTAPRFVEYAQEVGRRFGDRLASIATHNEPWVIATLGHQEGIFAPGIRDRRIAMQVAHHLLLSHGQALQALRSAGLRAPLGIVLNQSPIYPKSETAGDHAAARLHDGLTIRWYMDALLHGQYPTDVVEHLGADAPEILTGDMAAIRQPLDFLGINYYTRTVVAADGIVAATDSGLGITDMGWEVYPQGLTDLLSRLHAEYALPPVLITENGAAFRDQRVNGRIEDAQRVRYVQAHIAAIADARDRGVDVRGYFLWSLLDNFEWASGYEKRFGIVHVDYATQQRTLKDSALWYRRFLGAAKEAHPARPTAAEPLHRRIHDARPSR